MAELDPRTEELKEAVLFEAAEEFGVKESEIPYGVVQFAQILSLMQTPHCGVSIDEVVGAIQLAYVFWDELMDGKHQDEPYVVLASEDSENKALRRLIRAGSKSKCLPIDSPKVIASETMAVGFCPVIALGEASAKYACTYLWSPDDADVKWAFGILILPGDKYGIGWANMNSKEWKDVNMTA